jgi:hypothetical protein
MKSSQLDLNDVSDSAKASETLSRLILTTPNEMLGTPTPRRPIADYKQSKFNYITSRIGRNKKIFERQSSGFFATGTARGKKGNP